MGVNLEIDIFQLNPWRATFHTRFSDAGRVRSNDEKSELNAAEWYPS